MASVFDVAKFILEKRGRMSAWKLQKLCYYCQAWHYAWTERTMFPERFEAWTNGPVCPELFRAHQGKYIVGAEDVDGASANLTDDEKETVGAVLEGYGDLEPYDLRELTHREKPWRAARRGLPKDAKCTNEITPDAMGRYYGSL